MNENVINGLRSFVTGGKKKEGCGLMAVINMVNNIKELFPEYVLLFKIGTFYEVYNNDAKIISYLFQYKPKTLSSEDIVCGFPIVSINKILYLLEKKNINYIMLDKSHNYEEEGKVNYKKKNTYYEILKEATEYINRTSRIDKIRNYLLKDSSKLEQIENLIYER